MRERTSLMLWTKLLFDWPEIAPIEFIILLKKNRSKGVISPSPMPPIKPKTMKKQSRTSACMKMDLKEPFFFFLTLMETFFSSPPPICHHNKYSYYCSIVMIRKSNQIEYYFSDSYIYIVNNIRPRSQIIRLFYVFSLSLFIRPLSNFNVH